MLERIPSSVGHALRGVRAGYQRIVAEGEALTSAPDSISLTSPAFDDGGALPARCTRDGEGLSPPLTLDRIPPSARALALIVEDPDAPSREPFVHLLAFDLPPAIGELPEGLFASPKHEGLEAGLGRNALGKTAYLPPGPPPGHGPHLYVFQVFALNRKLEFERPPNRKVVVGAIRGHVLAKGVLVAIYQRPAG
jgi:hypothetical protein